MLTQIKFTYHWKLNAEVDNEQSPVFKCSFQNVSYVFALSKASKADNWRPSGRAEKFIFLKYIQGPKVKVRIEFSLEMIDVEADRKCNSCDKRRNLVIQVGNLGNSTDTFCKNHKNDLQENFNGLTIKCVIIFDIDEFEDFVHKDPSNLEYPYPTSTISKLFETTYSENGCFSDVTLMSSDGKLFRCHKNCLTQGSAVFDRMFTSGWSETVNGVVNIDEFNGDVLKEIIRFIYTGVVGFIVSDCQLLELFDLINAAEKYELKNLKEYCLCILFNRIDKDNVIDCLIVADRYNCQDVREKAISVITENSAQLQKTEKWSALTREHPRLLMELYNEALDRLNVTVEPF